MIEVSFLLPTVYTNLAQTDKIVLCAILHISLYGNYYHLLCRTLLLYWSHSANNRRHLFPAEDIFKQIHKLAWYKIIRELYVPVSGQPGLHSLHSCACGLVHVPWCCTCTQALHATSCLRPSFCNSLSLCMCAVAFKNLFCKYFKTVFIHIFTQTTLDSSYIIFP